MGKKKYFFLLLILLPLAIPAYFYLTVDSTELFPAIENDDFKTVRHLVRYGAKLYVRNADDETPLRFAVKRGNEEIIRILASKKGSNSYIGDSKGSSPLAYAVRENKINIVKILIEEGADVNVGWKSHKPLHFAAYSGNMEIVKLLLEKGADVNGKGYDDATPLHSAASGGHLAVVQLFIENGADVNAKDQKGQTPLHDAASKGHPAVVKVLYAHGALLKMKDKNRKTPYDYAEEQKNNEIVSLLQQIEKASFSDVHMAILSGDEDRVAAMIADGADINSHGECPLAPLHLAAREGRVSIAQLLVDHKADIHIRDRETGATPLFWAAEKGHTDTVEMLINNGADVNAQDADLHETPLHRAALHGKIMVLSLLIEKSADINRKDQYGYTPLNYAQSAGQPEAVVFLAKRGGEWSRLSPSPGDWPCETLIYGDSNNKGVPIGGCFPETPEDIVKSHDDEVDKFLDHQSIDSVMVIRTGQEFITSFYRSARTNFLEEKK